MKLNIKESGVINMIGMQVDVIVDRPMFSQHPEKPEVFYPINYGYIKDLIGGDGEELDAYILGVGKPVDRFTGTVIAVIHRLNDVEDKLVVAADNVYFSMDDVKALTAFREKNYETIYYMDPDKYMMEIIAGAEQSHIRSCKQ